GFVTIDSWIPVAYWRAVISLTVSWHIYSYLSLIRAAPYSAPIGFVSVGVACEVSGIPRANASAIAAFRDVSAVAAFLLSAPIPSVPPDAAAPTAGPPIAFPIINGTPPLNPALTTPVGANFPPMRAILAGAVPLPTLLIA